MKRVKKTYKIIVLLILTLLTINVKANNQDAITRSCIDSPSNNQSVGNTMVIQGWVMSKTANTEVKVYIDNQEEEIDRVKRPDVIKAITNFGTEIENPNPGYYKVTDIKNLPYGKHTMYVKVLKNDQVILND